MNVGFRELEVSDAIQSARISLRLFHPTLSPASPGRIGPYSLEVALDAPLAGEQLPLVIISHGTGGSGLVYRELAMRLARAGFVVALPEHPGDCRGDDGLAGTASNLQNRPRHLRLAIDAIFADRSLAPRLSQRGVAVIGHSQGGYTALALAGGKPTSFPYESPDGKAHELEVASDARVRALVLLAPAAVWFMADGSLDDVHVPILMMTAEKDEHVPAFQAELVLRGIRGANQLEHREIANAGHFAFLSPFPAAMVRPYFAPSQDPEGFDRAAFHQVMNAEILAFLRAHLG